MHRTSSGRGRAGRLGVVAVLLAPVLVACGPPAVGPAPVGPAPASARSPAASVATVAPTRAPDAATADPGPTSWRMPNLVGRGLQDAQDAIQALTDDRIFLTRSHDATGAGRHQILDRDWKVCDQNVRAGTTITADTVIDFGAVKLAERC